MKVLVLLSGGRDSVCLLHRLREEDVSALHVNYGLRGAESDADEAFCRELCERLGVELHVVRAGEPVGQRAGMGAGAALRRGASGWRATG